MTDVDADLVRRLADADTPPPPGTVFDGARLEARARLLRRRRLAAAAALLLASLPLSLLGAPRRHSEPDGGTIPRDALAGELRAMAAQVARLCTAFGAERPHPIDAPLYVRSELAAARAAALVTFHAEESRR